MLCHTDRLNSRQASNRKQRSFKRSVATTSRVLHSCNWEGIILWMCETVSRKHPHSFSTHIFLLVRKLSESSSINVCAQIKISVIIALYQLRSQHVMIRSYKFPAGVIERTTSNYLKLLSLTRIAKNSFCGTQIHFHR